MSITAVSDLCHEQRTGLVSVVCGSFLALFPGGEILVVVYEIADVLCAVSFPVNSSSGDVVYERDNIFSHVVCFILCQFVSI